MKKYTKWKETLKECSNKLTLGEYPVWWDGFHNVFFRGETSSLDDNPYHPLEQPVHNDYKAGAKAAESLMQEV